MKRPSRYLTITSYQQSRRMIRRAGQASSRCIHDGPTVWVAAVAAAGVQVKKDVGKLSPPTSRTPGLLQCASVVARRKGRKEIAPGGQRSVVRAFLPGCHGPHAFQPFLSTPVAGRRQQRVVPAAPDFFPRRRPIRMWETGRVETGRTVVCIVDILVRCTGSGVATKVR